MQIEKQKFFNVLILLSKQELEQFNDYLHSSNTKLTKKELDFFQRLTEYINFNPEQENKMDLSLEQLERLAKDVFKISEISKIRPYLSNLYKTLQNFIGSSSKILVEEQLVHTHYLAQLHFLNFLHKKKLHKHFQQDYKSLINDLKKEKKAEWLYFIQQKAEELYVDQQILDSNKKKEVDMEKLFELTAKHDFLCLIKRACTLKSLALSRNKVKTGIGLDSQIFLNFEEKAKYFQEDSLISLYYGAYLAFENKKNPRNLFEKIKILGKGIDPLEIQRLIKHIKNICLQQNWNGSEINNNSFFQEITEYQATADLIAPNKTISIRNFINIVSQAAKNKKFDWGYQFIEDHRSFLPKAKQKQIAKVGESLLFFRKGDYQKTIDILDVPEMYFADDLELENNRRTLIIKAMYELRKLDQTLEETTKYATHLRKTAKNLTQRHGQTNKLFLQNLNKLVNYQLKGMHNNKLCEKLKNLESVIQEKKMSNKEWLLEKVRKVAMTVA